MDETARNLSPEVDEASLFLSSSMSENLNDVISKIPLYSLRKEWLELNRSRFEEALFSSACYASGLH